MTALGNRNFRVFWIGASISNIGSWLQALTVPYVLFQVTGSAVWVGAATAAQYLPVMLLSPVGGSIADRYPRRRLLIITQVGASMVALLLCLAWAVGWHQPLVLLGFVAAGGVLQGLTSPAWQAFVNDLVDREDLMSAVTLNSLQFNAARAIGPGIAGLVLATAGPGWAFGLNAASYLATLVALSLIRGLVVTRRPAPAHGVAAQFIAALRYALHQPALVLVLVISVLIGVLANPVFGFTVVFSSSVYHVGPTALGLLNVAFGVGAVLVAPFLASSRRRMLPSRVVAIGLVALGCVLIAFGAVPMYAVAVGLLVVVGAGYLAVVSSIITSLQTVVSEEFRGRVMAVRLMVFTLAMVTGGLVLGAVADAVGPRWTMAGAGVGLLAAAGCLISLRGRLRLERLDDPGESDSSVSAA